MAINKTMRRQFEVAFSKHSQPVWFRVVKYVVLTCVLCFFWDSPYLWPGLLVMLFLALLLHFWYRYKTKGWTQSYGMWKYEKSKYDA